jgi:hypothetical protein
MAVISPGKKSPLQQGEKVSDLTVAWTGHRLAEADSRQNEARRPSWDQQTLKLKPDPACQVDQTGSLQTEAIQPRNPSWDQQTLTAEPWSQAWRIGQTVNPQKDTHQWQVWEH